MELFFVLFFFIIIVVIKVVDSAIQTSLQGIP